MLTDVLPVAPTMQAETVRRHVHATANRLEQALGDECECLFNGSEEDWANQPIPDGPMTVGLDGGYGPPAANVRNFTVSTQHWAILP